MTGAAKKSDKFTPVSRIDAASLTPQLSSGRFGVRGPVPTEDVIQAELTTGAANLDISDEVIECEIVDAVIGKLISDTTTSFLFINLIC